jgi:hypothetical protein
MNAAPDRRGGGLDHPARLVRAANGGVSALGGWVSVIADRVSAATG